METSSHDFAYCIMYWVKKLYIYKRYYEATIYHLQECVSRTTSEDCGSLRIWPKCKQSNGVADNSSMRNNCYKTKSQISTKHSKISCERSDKAYRHSDYRGYVRAISDNRGPTVVLRMLDRYA